MTTRAASAGFHELKAVSVVGGGGSQRLMVVLYFISLNYCSWQYVFNTGLCRVSAFLKLKSKYVTLRSSCLKSVDKGKIYIYVQFLLNMFQCLEYL